LRWKTRKAKRYAQKTWSVIMSSIIGFHSKVSARDRHDCKSNSVVLEDWLYRTKHKIAKQ
jgi:hypothetical protein